jgi:hypothetical protein
LLLTSKCRILSRFYEKKNHLIYHICKACWSIALREDIFDPFIPFI